MPAPDRLAILAPLPPEGEWRRALAVDRGAGPPRRVVLSFAPAALLDDPVRLAALVRDVEAAGRLHHPGAVPVLGTETLDDRLAIVEPFRPGTTVRALLDAAGRLPPDVAARIVVDACAAVARAHAIDAGEGRALVHGGIGASRLLVGEDGAALVSGFGACGGGEPGDDVRALAAVLFECLAGEPPLHAGAPVELPGVPAPLADAVGRALRPGGPPTAAALAQAIAGAGPLASHADVAAYAEAARPGAGGEEAPATPAARGLPERAEDLVVEPTDPVVVAARAAPAPPQAPPTVGGIVEPTFEPLPRPPATRPGADPAGVFAAPAPPPAPSRLPLAVVAVCLAAGFAAGFAAARAGVVPRLSGAVAVAGRGEPEVARPPEPLPAAAPSAPVGVEAIAEPPAPEPRPARASAPARRAKAQPAKARPARAAARAAGEPPVAGGFLDVTAPAGAEVFLDGRRIGTGDLRVPIPAGRHHIEVRLGEARAEQAFDIGPAETWTYAVTPAP